MVHEGIILFTFLRGIFEESVTIDKILSNWLVSGWFCFAIELPIFKFNFNEGLAVFD